MILPLPPEYFARVTQPFGVLSAGYKSGMHPGTDFGCPVGVPILAPKDGHITVVLNRKGELGNALYFAFEHEGRTYHMACLHLSLMMPQGFYKQGHVLGYTGNTGKSTGPHAHIEVWTRSVDRSTIYTKAGVARNLLDPVQFFSS